MCLGFHDVCIERFRDLGRFPQDLLSYNPILDDVLDFSLRAHHDPTAPILHGIYDRVFVLHPFILHLNVGSQDRSTVPFGRHPSEIRPEVFLERDFKQNPLASVL